MEQVQLSNLVKGERVELTQGKSINKLIAGLGWDINGGNAGSYDLDALAFHLKDGKLYGGNNGVAFYGNKKIAGVELDKDNLTGEGEGDDERLFIDLSAVPAEVTEVVIGVNIYNAASKRQNFGMVSNAYICLRGEDGNIITNESGKQMRFDLSEDYSAFTAILAAKLYRKDGEWKFQAIGEGKNGDVQSIANSF